MGIFEVFYQPGTLFATLDKRRMAWLLPLILGVLCLLGTSAAVIHYIGMETIIRQQLEGTRLTAEQMQLALNRAQSPTQLYVTYAGTVIVGTLSYLLIAGLLTVFALMSSKQPKFSANLSLVTLSFFPYRLIILVMSVLVLMTAPDKSVLDVSNLLATNVGAFMNKDAISKPLYTFLSQLDVLSFAEIGLMGYGFSKVNRSSVGFGVISVLSLWIVYALIRVGISAIF